MIKMIRMIKLRKIEQVLNRVIEKIGSSVRELVFLIIPAPILSILKRLAYIAWSFILLIKLLFSPSTYSKSFLFKVFNKIIYKIRKFTYYLESFSYESFTLETLWKKIKKFSKNAYDFSSSRPMIIVFGLIAFFSGVGLFFNLHKFYQGVKEFASDQQMIGAMEYFARVSMEPRRNYYGKDRKHFNILEIRLPPHLKRKERIKSVVINFTIESSNSYIREFFSRNIYLVEDKLYMTFEQVPSSLSLSTEGKIIIKEKIKMEMNKLIKELKIQGEVVAVYINSILVG